MKVQTIQKMLHNHNIGYEITGENIYLVTVSHRCNVTKWKKKDINGLIESIERKRSWKH